MSARTAIVAIVLSSLACATTADAQPIPVIAVTTRDAPADDGIGPVNRVSAAIGPDALSGSALAQALAAHYASAPRTGDPLATARAHVRAAIAQWVQAARTADAAAQTAALDALDAAAREMEGLSEALDASDENRRTLRQALVFLAERANEAHASTRLDDAMRRLARVDTGVAFSARDASPQVQQAYQQAVAALPRGALAVNSQPDGCRVVRDGRPAGSAPVELQDLAPGEHRIAVECGAAHSLVHRVDVAAQTRATVVIDAQLDAALASAPIAALRYATAAEIEPRLDRDLATLGRSLDAQRIYAVIVRADRVRVIDVPSGQRVGESPVTDGARLRLLATTASAPGPSPVAASEPHTTPAPVASTAPSSAPPPTPPRTLTVHRTEGPPAATFVIGVLGLAAMGVGGYFATLADGATNRAEQTGSQPTDTPQTRVDALAQANTDRDVEMACIAGGAALVVTALLIGVFARGETTSVVQAGIVPSAYGGGVVARVRF